MKPARGSCAWRWCSGHVAVPKLEVIAGRDQVHETLASRRTIVINDGAANPIGLGEAERELVDGAILCEEFRVLGEITVGLDADTRSWWTWWLNVNSNEPGVFLACSSTRRSAAK